MGNCDNRETPRKKILLIFASARLEPLRMRLLNTPRLAALATLVVATRLALPAQAADSPEGGAGATATVAPIDGTGILSIDAVTFKSVPDPFQRNPWMQVEVDFTGRKNPDPKSDNPKYLQDVQIDLILAWGVKGATPQVDTVLTGTIHFLGIEVNNKCATYFFVPPEFLDMGFKGKSYVSTTAPTYYVVQAKVAGIPLKINASMVSTISLPNEIYVNGFLGKIAGMTASTAGIMLTGTDTPAYIYNPMTIQHPTATLPTEIRPGAAK